jgi:hypothetical protein
VSRTGRSVPLMRDRTPAPDARQTIGHNPARVCALCDWGACGVTGETDGDEESAQVLRGG